MSDLLREIQHLDREAAKVLMDADLHTDSAIQSLTREDLNELFPGREKFKLRREIFEKARTHKPTDRTAQLLRELKGFIPDECLRASLTGNVVLVDYLNILKDMKTQMNNIQRFLDAHIELLQDFNKDPPVQDPDKGYNADADTDAVDHSGQKQHNTGPADGHAQGDTWKSTSSGEMMSYTAPTKRYQSSPMGSLKRKDLLQVKYKEVITGKTFKADEQLMHKVMANVKGRVQFIKSMEDAHATIVFCPVTSRVGSDVDAAMKSIRDNKPVILVLMHHTYEVKCRTSLRTWETNYTQDMLHVNIFYHETVRGLLQCTENDQAVSAIQRRLVEKSIEHAGKSAADVDWYLNGGTPDGNNRGNDGGGGFFNFSVGSWSLRK